MFRTEQVTITTTSVICDGCGKSQVLGKGLGFDDRMNGCLHHGFTFTKDENGKFKNYCKACQ